MEQEINNTTTTTEVVEKKDQAIAINTQAGFLQAAHNFVAKNGTSMLPPNYDVNSAVKSLYLKAVQTQTKDKKPVLEACTPASIAQCIQTYISNGLNIDKNQCYLIAYGKSLNLQIGSYGKEKQAKTYAKITQHSGVIYEGEQVKVIYRPNGTKIIEYTPDLSKWDTDKIAYAFSVATRENGEIDDTEIMTRKELRASASKSQSGGTVWKEFPVEMSRKTVVARQAKHYINSTDDSVKFEVISDVGDFEASIDADAVIEDDDTYVKENTQVETTTTATNDDYNFQVDENIDSDRPTKEIYYSEFKNHKDQYTAVPNSYDKDKKTIKVYC